MNNTQKILVIIGIMLFIIILDIWTCKEADNLVNNVLGDLDNLKELLLNENFEESKSKSEELNKKWSEYENKLSFFIERDNLENVTSKIAIISENAINKQYKEALEDLVEARYLLEHVKDKNKLKLENIFLLIDKK